MPNCDTDWSITACVRATQTHAVKVTRAEMERSPSKRSCFWAEMRPQDCLSLAIARLSGWKDLLGADLVKGGNRAGSD